MNFIDWVVKEHADTNHMYDKYLPYEIHIRLVNSVCQEFYPLIAPPVPLQVASYSCFGHDLIEDTRANYGSIRKALIASGTVIDNIEPILKIIQACTSYVQGENREARMPDWVYKAIRDTPGATFVKLCDRIANLRYGTLMKSDMVNTYREEKEKFRAKLYTPEYNLMFNHIEELVYKPD